MPRTDACEGCGCKVEIREWLDGNHLCNECRGNTHCPECAKKDIALRDLTLKRCHGYEGEIEMLKEMLAEKKTYIAELEEELRIHRTPGHNFHEKQWADLKTENADLKAALEAARPYFESHILTNNIWDKAREKLIKALSVLPEVEKEERKKYA